MKNKLLLVLIVSCMPYASGIFAQSPSSSKIYMPLDFRQAYEKGTRTYNGFPGSNFWQNTCIYKIQVDVNPSTRELNGKEWIEYINNSQDTIKRIYFNTYQDVYRKGSQRSYDMKEETKGIVIDSIIINGINLTEKDRSQNMTLLYNNLPLKRPLFPKSSCKIEIAWKAQFPKTVIDGREGFADSTSAFIGLWYPKICVFDDIFKWNRNIYNGLSEFYSPLSTYDVSISLPGGFLVWATGNLQNQNNYPAFIKERLAKVLSLKGIESIVDSTTILKSDEIGKGPWIFHADSVPDFAFCFSNHYLWDATSLEIRNKKVIINSLYPKKQIYFRDLTDPIKKSMQIYSLEDPGILYPYPYFTSFYGLPGGGMEYPMMSFDGTIPGFDAYIVIHEMLHSYVPFYLRTNETKFSWMDEGLTHFYSLKILKKIGLYNETIKSFISRQLEPEITGTGNLPLFTSSSYFDINNNAGMFYLKPDQMLTSLEDEVGIDLWKKCYAAFAQTWRYKSPTPYDFMFFIENYTKKDLFWFWDAWFMHFGMPDISIQKVADDKIVLDNKGGLPIPFTLELTDMDGKIQQIIYHSDSWINGRVIEIKQHTGKLSKVEVKCDLVADFNPADNIWKK